ncbi:Inosose dehydratase [Pirellula sp. SH-Sr6A]|uniref:sugar phosphate isomerase/epimerase family protein n=1 Tax=Pirellula sp. SH-Sr6A TaxID=1632865 RepID=UPI00078B2D14|nr:sugar phosphate isomerase/epimerase [Pirellula sp. SH-Sr6A]AMV32999.1 Inosose dehydratase [Pirellula sp. SH-Sr6A]
MMQLGFVSAILPELELAQVLQSASQIGYRCVEVMCWPPSKAERRYAGITHINVDDLSDASIATIARLQQETGVFISGLGYYPNCLSPDEAEAERCTEHLKRVIAAAPKLGIDRVNTFIGRDFTKSVDDNWPRLLKTWKPIVDLAEKQGVRIGIENCPMLFTQDEWPGGKNIATSPAIWRRLFSDLGSPNLGLNYDPSHMVWQCMDYLKPLRDFIDRIFHVHAKDVRIDRHRLDEVGIFAHPKLYHSPKLPGLGEIDWGQFFSVLSDEGYVGPVCVEVEDRAYEATVESRTEALAQSYRYLSQFAPR